MNMLTCLALVKGIDEANSEIMNKRKEGYYLRGTPIPLADGWLLLTFEKPDSDAEDGWDSDVFKD